MHYSHSYGVVSLQISQFIRFREIWFYNVCVCNVLCVTAGHTVGIVSRLFTLCTHKECVLCRTLRLEKRSSLLPKFTCQKSHFKSSGVNNKIKLWVHQFQELVMQVHQQPLGGEGYDIFLLCNILVRFLLQLKKKGSRFHTLFSLLFIFTDFVFLFSASMYLYLSLQIYISVERGPHTSDHKIIWCQYLYELNMHEAFK